MSADDRRTKGLRYEAFVISMERQKNPEGNAKACFQEMLIMLALIKNERGFIKKGEKKN